MLNDQSVVSLRTLYAHDVSPGSSPVNGLRTAASASSGSTGSSGREPIPDYRPGPPIATHDSADSSSGKKRGVTQIQDDRIDYPRRRAVIACEICRARKSKCDGAQPKCRLCNDLNAECVYRERGLKYNDFYKLHVTALSNSQFRLDARDKLILDKLDNIQSILQNSVEKEQLQTQIIQRLGLQLQENFQQQQAQRLSGGRAAPNEPSARYLASGVVESSPQISHGSSASGREQVSSDSHREYVFSIPEHHSTPWLHLFQHPKISRFLSSSPPSVLSPLALEKSRPPLQLNANVLLDLSHVQPFVTSFFKNVNPFYALVSPFSWKSYYRIALSRGFRAGPESVIVLLVLALGEASMKESLSVSLPDGPIPGLKFFASAWPLVTNILISNSVMDAEALMLTSAYLFYLVRPLEAWTILSATCMKVRAIIATTPPETLLHDEKEQFERVFWNALVFERDSDVLAELDLPHSGIEVHEDDVGLPSGFISVPEAAALAPGTDDLWYFLAEVALRRLLNRVHHMLYSKTVKMPISSYHPIVQELDFQLNQWYENLPPVLRFSFERRRLDNRFSTVLRLRYFACQSIIWRVYVEFALQDEQLLQDSRIRMGASKCIEACLRQIEDIDEHQAGHVPYLWQGSLSIVSHLLMLMAVTTSSGLSQLLSYKLDRMADIVTVGIRTIIRNGKLAPSIKAAAESLCDVERQWAAQMRELGVVLPDLSIETINVPRGGRWHRYHSPIIDI
ncbi:hypothetical protein POJ06DRAFT_298625 [Lipomyces tetrasporus]|uniref:Zn(2)-C6 fungal-type domain-containing protein n=1 Tax=Lipomyces tetrasporus TaxID=54092 RepID=A0AAD7QZD5_9ASCO|nr:uncharacterized protein POJ06DRAFT_298625 [Lipomyces tetrasporus]KAJ8104266.1 hypothetical protein POJ06DRAFT_298625 [Lipomyces tetrasporus]